MSARVVVTGLGAICAAGRSISEIWHALLEGRSAIAPIRQWDGSGPQVPPAGEVWPFEPVALVPERKTHKLLRRGDFLGLFAARQALRHAALLDHRASLAAERALELDERTGIFAGAGGTGYDLQYDFFPLLAQVGRETDDADAARSEGTGDPDPARSAGGREAGVESLLVGFGRGLQGAVTPVWLLRTMPNNVLCHLGIQTGFKGPNSCVAAHGVSGAFALLEASAAIRAGEIDRAVVVGHDAPLEAQAVHELASLGLLTSEALRPFDRRRSGTVLGEGAAALVLESAEAARQRGARPLAEVLGAGAATEPTGLLSVREDGDGAARAIDAALAEARVDADAIGMVVAHGNGTTLGDLSEARALHRRLSGGSAPVTTCKWAFGHTLAAAGLLDALVAIEALRGGAVPRIASLREPDPELPPLALATSTTVPTSPRALVLTRGFAGLNVALLLGLPSASRLGRAPGAP